MYVMYNPNPISAQVGDCTVRALTKALDISWEDAYTRLCANGYLMGDMPSSDKVWGAALREHGFRRFMISDTCPDCYTVADFCKDHPRGVYVLKSEGHVATVVDGSLYDSWNSEHKVPFYYWTKEE